MANVNVVKLKVRRGTDAQRKLIVLDQGEIGYTVDSKRLFVGDGIMPGGYSAGVQFYNVTDITTATTLQTAITGDLVYDQSQTLYYILTGGAYNDRSAYRPLAQYSVVYNGPYRQFNGSLGSIQPISGSNIASGNYATVAGGFSNIASGSASFVASGSANDTKGFANTFILGSSLSATQSNYTYVNNISSQGVVAANPLRVGNSQSATVSVGSLANKIEVFNAAGVSLGFIPVYTTIT
jgi:hypothetical protein